MEKELLKAMYEKKDPKRRRKLFEYFKPLFAEHLSARLTVEIINKELGADFAGMYDVKYIRSHVAKWNHPEPARKEPVDKIPKAVNEQLPWSEPDELRKQSFKSSKFSKP